MSRSKELANTIYIFTIGNIGSKVLAFALVPIYTFFLTRSELGYYDLVLTTLNLVMPFLSCQLSDAIYRWLLENPDETGIKRTITSAYLFICSSLVIASIIYTVISYMNDLGEYSGFISVMLITSCLFPIIQQTARGFRQNKTYAVSGVLNVLILLICNVFFLVVFKYKIKSLFISIIIANSLSILFIAYRLKIAKYFDLKFFSKDSLKQLVTYSIPLIPNVVSWWLVSSANRFLIVYFLGQDANGLYAISYRLPSIIVMVNSIFTLAWQENAITSFNNQDEQKTVYYNRLFEKYLILELSLVALLVASTKLIMHFIVNHNFYDAWKYMSPLYLSVAFTAFASFLGAGYLGAKQTKGVFTSTIIGGVVNIALTVSLIKYIGLLAPALGTMFGFLVTWIIRYFHTKNFFHIQIPWRPLITLLVVSAICIVLLQFDIIWIQAVNIVFATSVFVYYNRSLFQFFYTLLNSKINFFRKKAKFS